MPTRHFKVIILFFILFPFQVSAAGHVIDAKITSVYCGYEGTYNMCSVVFDKVIIDKDSCHTINSNRMQFKGNGEMGGSLLSIALAAYMAHKKVNIYSTGSCTVYNGLADVKFIEVKN